MNASQNKCTWRHKECSACVQIFHKVCSKSPHLEYCLTTSQNFRAGKLLNYITHKLPILINCSFPSLVMNKHYKITMNIFPFQRSDYFLSHFSLYLCPLYINGPSWFSYFNGTIFRIFSYLKKGWGGLAIGCLVAIQSLCAPGTTSCPKGIKTISLCWIFALISLVTVRLRQETIFLCLLSSLL